MPAERRYWVNPSKLGPLGNLPQRYEPEGAIIEGEGGRLFRMGPGGKLRRIAHRKVIDREAKMERILKEKLSRWDDSMTSGSRTVQRRLAIVGLIGILLFTLGVFLGAL